MTASVLLRKGRTCPGAKHMPRGTALGQLSLKTAKPQRGMATNLLYSRSGKRLKLMLNHISFDVQLQDIETVDTREYRLKRSVTVRPHV